MTIVCWGNLAKSADDVLRIEQSMENYVSSHEQNANAHMGTTYSLGLHRVQDILDHAFYSVRNISTYPQIRTYKAIVDPAGYGDLTDIQTAINYVNGLGGGAILVKSGTYVQTSDITLYSNIQLIGEDDDTTIIDFNETEYNMRIRGTVGTHLTNVTIENLRIEGCRRDEDHAINAYYVDDLTIKKCYFTDNYRAENGGAATYGDINTQLVTQLLIEGCRFVSSGASIVLTDINQGVAIGNYSINSNGLPFQISTCTNMRVEGNTIVTPNANYGIQDDGNISLFVTRNHITEPLSAGINVSSDGNANFSDNYILGDTLMNNGIRLNNSTNNVYEGNTIVDAVDNGFYLANADNNLILGNYINGSGAYGISITSSTSANNLIIANYFNGNVTGNIDDNGTTNNISNNKTI